jgi:23S rRNA (cytidine1920-2'-O)/16S rRNA (cytidine1409-2'-O)-methyltransferase
MERLDRFLTKNNLSSSREKAKKEILAGWVKINGETCRVASRKISGDEKIEVSRPGGEYVSRGGYKLEKALAFFTIDPTGYVVLDLGASTGGFTDCLLKHGAQKVYAVDVGYGQLDYLLRSDPRVVVLERTNARHLTHESIDDSINLITADLSFISITKVFPVIQELFPDTHALFLVKPQFEAKQNEHKKGVVKEAKKLQQIVLRTINALIDNRMQFLNFTFSPIKGPKGNIEFLLFCKTTGDNIINNLQEKLKLK